MFLVWSKCLFIILCRKLSSCMNAQPLTISDAGAVPINMPEGCYFTNSPNCTNHSSNMKFIHPHRLAPPTLNSSVMLVILLVFTGGLRDQCILSIFGSFSPFLYVETEIISIATYTWYARGNAFEQSYSLIDGRYLTPNSLKCHSGRSVQVLLIQRPWVCRSDCIISCALVRYNI